MQCRINQTNNISSHIMEHLFHTSATQLKHQLKSNDWPAIIRHICYIVNNEIIMDFHYFKHIGNSETYSLILSNVVNNIDTIVKELGHFVLHINVKSLSVSDVDKHQGFLQQVSDFFKMRYEGKLLQCHIYNAPFVFAQVYQLVKRWIDKETQEKITIHNS
jgi:hypothetical protein